MWLSVSNDLSRTVWAWLQIDLNAFENKICTQGEKKVKWRHKDTQIHRGEGQWRQRQRKASTKARAHGRLPAITRR